MPEYGDQVDRWFAQKGVQPRCTQCGHDEFGGGDLIPLYALERDDPSGQMKGYTAVPIVCQNCGHFELFSANLIGMPLPWDDEPNI